MRNRNNNTLSKEHKIVMWLFVSPIICLCWLGLVSLTAALFIPTETYSSVINTPIVWLLGIPVFLIFFIGFLVNMEE